MSDDSEALPLKRTRGEGSVVASAATPSTENQDGAASGAAINLSQPFHHYLHHRVEEYRSLREEIILGWNTTALDQRFADSQQHHLDVSRTGGSSVDAAMQRKVKGYTQWCQTTLKAAAPQVFEPQPTATESRETRRFLDIGSAPGGMSCFLHEHLRWAGIASSLGEDAGGMPMAYKPAAESVTSAPKGGASKLLALMGRKKPPPKPSAPAETSRRPEFTFIPADLTDGKLSRQLFGMFPTADEVGDVDAAQRDPRSSGVASYDVVMAGAVQDQTQRHELPPGEGDAASSGDTSAALNQRLMFTAAQLALAVMGVKRGGTIMLVYGPSDCGSLASVAHHVLLRLVETPQDIHVLPTMHVEKTPVYILLTNVLNGGAAVLQDLGVDMNCSESESSRGKIASWVRQSLRLNSDNGASFMLPDAPDATPSAKTGAVIETFEQMFLDDLRKVWSLRQEKLRSTRLMATRNVERDR